MEDCPRSADDGAGAKEVFKRVDELTWAMEAAQEAGVGAVRAAGKFGDLGALAASLGGDSVVGFSGATAQPRRTVRTNDVVHERAVDTARRGTRNRI